MYTTATDLKLYLGITETDDDALLGRLIASAQAMIDAHCRQTFEASVDSTRYFDPTTQVVGRTLFLDAPLCAITTVTNGDGNAIGSTLYVKEPRNETPWRQLTLKSNAAVNWTYTSTPENSIAIVGRWAYSTSAPADVAHACLRLAAFLYRQKDNQSGDLDRPVNLGGGAMMMPATLPNDIKTILAPYRRLVI